MPRSIRSSISKRIKFHDRPDLFNGKYFYITAPYGLFYLLGGIIGYNITYNLFCLLISCSIGILFIILSIAHAIDYYNKAPIASFYVSLPFGKNYDYNFFQILCIKTIIILVIFIVEIIIIHLYYHHSHIIFFLIVTIIILYCHHLSLLLL